MKKLLKISIVTFCLLNLIYQSPQNNNNNLLIAEEEFPDSVVIIPVKI